MEDVALLLAGVAALLLVLAILGAIASVWDPMGDHDRAGRRERSREPIYWRGR